MDPVHRIINIITSAGIVQGLFLSFAVLRTGRGSKDANKYLSFMLFFFSATIAIQEIFALAARFSLDRYFLLMGGFQLLLGPLLYFYAKVLASELNGKTGPGFTHGGGDMAHFAPFLLYVLSLSLLRLFSGIPAAGLFAEVQKSGRVIWSALLVHTAAYLFVIMRSLHRLVRDLKSRYARIEEIDLSWLRYLASAFLIAYLVLALLMLLLSHNHPLIPRDVTVSLVLSILVYALGWRGFFQGPMPPWRADGGANRIQETPGSGPAAKYAHSGLTAEETSRLLVDVRRLMDEEKPYLDPDVSLPSLAEEAGLSSGALSRVINEAAGASFYDFINAYRVREAERLLADPTHADRGILDIAFGVGFRSKSTFNASFKHATGLTPGEFRARRSASV